ncbi:hypothetical protein C5167_027982 [Papaver somniferum]|nr:hypothetical protein C5167_027982 [Papaver somniferum]
MLLLTSVLFCVNGSMGRDADKPRPQSPVLIKGQPSPHP